MKFKVIYSVSINSEIDVEATSPEEARIMVESGMVEYGDANIIDEGDVDVIDVIEVN